VEGKFCFVRKKLLKMESKVADTTSTVVIAVYSKNVLTKDSFLVSFSTFNTNQGQVTLDLAEYQQEEIVSKWFQLDNRLDRRDPNLGQLLLKFQLLQTERGKMYKLNDYLEVDFYDPLKDVRENFS
jgi:hypothetical protein